MALQRTFASMLNEYVTGGVLTESLVKRMWFMNTVEMKTNWKNGGYPVAFEGNAPNSMQFGGLTPVNDIAEGDYVRGYIPEQIKATHSLIFNQEDLAEHDGKIPETTFLDVMEQQVGPGMNLFKEALSHQMIGGPAVAVVTDSTNAATGKFVVDRIERLNLKQKFSIKDNNSAAQTVYVKAIDLNTGEATFSLSRGGAAADLSAYTSGQAAKLYHPGGENGTFTSMKGALLSAANSGDATLYGKTKLDYPYLQCINKSGSDVTGSNILDKLFDFWLFVRQRARGNANELVMSYKHWGSIMKSQQIQKGAYKVVSDPKRSEFGWWNTQIASTTNGEALTITAVQEFDDDVIVAFDKGSVHIASNGGVQKLKTPEGKEYYVVRNTSGYQYVVDVIFRGQTVWKAPTRNGILHSINY